MRLHGAGWAETSVELRVVGYQTAPEYLAIGDAADDPEPDEWLVVTFDVSDPRGSWHVVDPSLTVLDAAELRDWLRRAADGSQRPSRPSADGTVTPSLRFLEPNLAFSVQDQTDTDVTIRVHFSGESSPPWALGDRWSGQNWVTVTLTPTELRASADQWATELAAFPQRTWVEPSA